MIQGDNQQVTLGWLAGILDGEGAMFMRCYHVERKQRSLNANVKISSTDPRIIVRSAEALDMIGVKYHIAEYPAKVKRKVTYDLSIGRQMEIKRLLDVIIPHLTRLQARAQLMLRFCNSRLKYGKMSGHTSYTKDEISTAIRIVEANGDQKGTSQTIRETFKHLLSDDIVGSHVKA